MAYIEPPTDLKKELHDLQQLLESLARRCHWDKDIPADMNTIDARSIYKRLQGRASVIERELGY